MLKQQHQRTHTKKAVIFFSFQHIFYSESKLFKKIVKWKKPAHFQAVFLQETNLLFMNGWPIIIVPVEYFDYQFWPSSVIFIVGMAE